jgi:hypothetical protein
MLVLLRYCNGVNLVSVSQHGIRTSGCLLHPRQGPLEHVRRRVERDALQQRDFALFTLPVFALVAAVSGLRVVATSKRYVLRRPGFY